MLKGWLLLPVLWVVLSMVGCTTTAHEVKQRRPTFSVTSSQPPLHIVECVHGNLASEQVGMASRVVSVLPIIDRSNAPNQVQLIGRQSNSVLYVLISESASAGSITTLYEAHWLNQPIDAGKIANQVIEITNQCAR